MPTERAPTPLSQTAISVGTSSDDRNSERSDSTATVEIFRSDGDPFPASGTPSENTENTERENVSRHRTPNVDDGREFASSDIPEIPLERKKSNGISKGVILNAVNFGSYDLKNPSEIKDKPVVLKDQELCENGSLPPKALEESEKNGKVPEDETEEEKKKMSLPRKIAFGISFVPSVMFVLTFAVILPCEEYKYDGQCVKNRWSLSLNNTEITTDFSLPDTLLLGYHFSNSTGSFDGIVNVNDRTGKEVWRLPLDSQPKLLECLEVDASNDGVEDCLTILENGNVCAFNLSDGHVLWTFNSNQSKDAATVLLSGCPYYKSSKPTAVASYAKENTLGIDVLSSTDGSLLASKKVQLPDKCITFSMKSWKHDSEMDLVFYCKNIQNLGYVWRVKQSLWCPPQGQSIIVPQELMRFDENKTEASIYLPTAEGVLVWAGNQVTFLNSDGTRKWQDSTRYVPQIRVAKFGGFYIGGEQVALIGQNASSGIEVSVLTSADGKELATLSIPDRTLNQAIVLQGNKTDALLISVFEVKVTDTEQESDKDVVLLSNVNSSSNFRKDVPYKVNGKRSVVEELILFQFGEKNTTHVVLKNEIPVSCKNGEACEPEYQASRIISTSTEEKENLVNLKIVRLNTPDNNLKQNGSQLISQLTALDITHQDNAVNGETTCTL